MRAFELLTELPITIEPDATLTDAQETMDTFGIRHLPVTEAEHIVGILSNRDTLIATGLERGAAGDSCKSGHPQSARPVSGIMSSPVHCVAHDTPVGRIAETMLTMGVSIVPVIDGKGFIGVVSKSDLVRLYIDLCRRLDSRPAPAASVESCMRRNVVTVSPSDEARQVVTTMTGARIEHIPVVRDGRLMGIIADRDLRRHLGVTVHESTHDTDRMYAERFDTPAELIMTPEPVTVSPDDRMDNAAAVMFDRRFSALPVTSAHGELVGIVTVTDVVRLVRDLTGGVEPAGVTTG